MGDRSRQSPCEHRHREGRRHSTFFLHHDGKSWQEYDAAAELPKLAALGLTVLERSGPDIPRARPPPGNLLEPGPAAL
ncbi:hypothetical protein [Streptomyces sp. NPDC055105]|uniref:hypothetical protein n=1 Tax=Streptomyces sp. NPDC055105 TaxID=3365719 RepID=UPI0037D6EE93